MGQGGGGESEGKGKGREKRTAERRAKREERKTPHNRFCIQGLIVKLVGRLFRIFAFSSPFTNMILDYCSLPCTYTGKRKRNKTLKLIPCLAVVIYNSNDKERGVLKTKTEVQGTF